jgi:(2Fe-2S) ferredoxin
MVNFYQKHMFFCTNLKPAGKACCAHSHADDALQWARDYIKSLGLYGPGNIRVSQAGCLGRCDQGPCLVIYPEGIWYTYRNQEDVLAIIDEHCLGNRLVERLLIDPVSTCILRD